MNLFYQPQIPEGHYYLNEDESRHCTRVLRKRRGDPIRITDGRGHFYEAVIEDDAPKQCTFRIVSAETAVPRSVFIHVAVSPTKNADRIEWFVEKATELGIDRITLLKCDHTENTFVKPERLRKVAVSAMKQSLKAMLPEIEALTSFRQVIESASADGRFIAHVDASNPVHLLDSAKNTGPSYLTLIGPEGDFSPEELDLALANRFEKVSLGSARLRTETAAVAACHILNLVNP